MYLHFCSGSNCIETWVLWETKYFSCDLNALSIVKGQSLQSVRNFGVINTGQ